MDVAPVELNRFAAGKSGARYAWTWPGVTSVAFGLWAENVRPLEARQFAPDRRHRSLRRESPAARLVGYGPTSPASFVSNDHPLPTSVARSPSARTDAGPDRGMMHHHRRSTTVCAAPPSSNSIRLRSSATPQHIVVLLNPHGPTSSASRFGLRFDLACSYPSNQRRLAVAS